MSTLTQLKGICLSGVWLSALLYQTCFSTCFPSYHLCCHLSTCVGNRVTIPLTNFVEVCFSTLWCAYSRSCSQTWWLPYNELMAYHFTDSIYVDLFDNCACVKCQIVGHVLWFPDILTLSSTLKNLLGHSSSAPSI